MLAPVAAAMESTTPSSVRPFMSTSTSAFWPGRIFASCVSLKFATTKLCSGTIVMRDWPGWSTWPSWTVLRVTLPSTGAVMVQ